jgi:hypothetical protein
MKTRSPADHAAAVAATHGLAVGRWRRRTRRCSHVRIRAAAQRLEEREVFPLIEAAMPQAEAERLVKLVS